MPKFAAGKYAYGISDRSGFRYRLKDMRREWTGFLVGKDEWEAKHPQLEPRHQPTDAEALRNPRPDTNNIISETVKFPSFSLETLQYISTPKGNLQLGSVTLGGSVIPTVNHTELLGSVSSLSALGSVTVQGASLTTLTITVSNPGYGNRYYVSSYSGPAPTITLNEGSTYRLDQSDASNSGHPLRFSTTSDGTHGGGTQYTTGVTTNGTPGTSGAYTQITVATGAPTLYYYCQVHSGMGGQANTP